MAKLSERFQVGSKAKTVQLIRLPYSNMTIPAGMEYEVLEVIETPPHIKVKEQGFSFYLKPDEEIVPITP